MHTGKPAGVAVFHSITWFSDSAHPHYISDALPRHHGITVALDKLDIIARPVSPSNENKRIYLFILFILFILPFSPRLGCFSMFFCVCYGM